MSEKFKTAIVRFLTTEEEVVGTGFLVGDRHILTCAHVVNSALDIPETTVKKPTEIILLDFPFVAKGEHLKAKVIKWYPVADDNVSDIAILELLDAIPNNCQSLSTLKNHQLGHSFQAYGFPQGYGDKSIFTQGTIKANLADGTVQIQDCKIEEGFSGGPVWDEQAVVGIIVGVDEQDSSLAFFIPTNILIKAWDKLSQYCRPSKKQESIPLHLLPYSPDRDKQIWALRDAIKKRAEKFPDKHRPLLCVIHGDEYQCLSKFVDRFILEPKIISEQMVDYGERNAKYLRLPNIVNDFGGRILAGLEYFPKIPFILYSEIYTEDWQYYGKTDIIHDFINFWINDSNYDTPPLLVCLCFNYQTRFLYRFKNNKIKRVFDKLASEQPHDVVVLPELLSIERRDVEDWARIYLNEHFYEIMPYVRNLFKKPKQKIAMEPLAHQLKQILKECYDKRDFQT